MEKNIKILNVTDSKPVEYKITKFPCGELQVRLEDPYDVARDTIAIIARIKSSEDIMVLLQIKACLDLWYPYEISLSLGYVPYARQDRICNQGECHSLKVFANLINSMNFDQVALYDPHSDVAEPLFNNAITLPKEWILDNLKEHLKHIDVFVAPDAGASKEVQNLAITFGKEFIQGYKKRDPETGNLSGFGYYGDIEGKNILIVDDLCDGGGTFLGLGNELRKGNPAAMSLYVTHGCFTKGLVDLQGMFDVIYTTNTYRRDLVQCDDLIVFPALSM